jgi:hypothetical protein
MFPYIPIYGLFMEYNLLYLLHFLIIYCLHIQKQQPETLATIICHFDELSLTLT